MEQTVWIYFSVIAILIALGIVTNLMVKNTQTNQNENLVNSIYQLQSQCDFVCRSGVETNLPINVKLPSEAVVFTKENKICGTFKDSMKCVICSCALRQYTLNLNTTFAIKAFKLHDYICYFKKLENEIEMECKG